jgi:hypothetical protein
MRQSHQRAWANQRTGLFFFASPATFSTKRHTFPQRDRGGTVTDFKLLSRSSRGLDARVVLLVRHASTKVRYHMPSAKDFRHYAQQCLRYADETEDDQDREIFLEMATVWTQLELTSAPADITKRNESQANIGPVGTSAPRMLAKGNEPRQAVLPRLTSRSATECRAGNNLPAQYDDRAMQ